MIKFKDRVSERHDIVYFTLGYDNKNHDITYLRTNKFNLTICFLLTTQ
jgi:hypothetical protein